MLGLGTWKFKVDTMFFRGDAKLIVAEKNGEYDITIDIPGETLPEIGFDNIQAEGNTVTGTARTDLLKGKDIPFSCTFEGDTANGLLKVPMLGKIKLNNGVKIA